MQIELKLSNSVQAERKIFDKDFQVDEMTNPQKYLPQYQKNQEYETSPIEQCMVCCGGLCMICAIPFGCCGSTDCCCCYTLPTSQVGLVESFGRFQRLLKPGLNMINPCSEEIAMVDMKIKVLTVGRHVTMTKDNVKLTVDSSVAYRLTNPVIAHYILGNNMNRVLIESTTAALRETIGDYTLDRVLSERMQIAIEARNALAKNVQDGIKIQNIFVEQIIVPREIQSDLTSAARQRRVGGAQIINSKADVETASLMKQSAQLLDTKAAMQIRYLEMVEDLGKRGVILIMGIGVNKKGF